MGQLAKRGNLHFPRSMALPGFASSTIARLSRYTRSGCATDPFRCHSSSLQEANLISAKSILATTHTNTNSALPTCVTITRRLFLAIWRQLNTWQISTFQMATSCLDLRRQSLPLSTRCFLLHRVCIHWRFYFLINISSFWKRILCTLWAVADAFILYPSRVR